MQVHKPCIKPQIFDVEDNLVTGHLCQKVKTLSDIVLSLITSDITISLNSFVDNI